VAAATPPAPVAEPPKATPIVAAVAAAPTPTPTPQPPPVAAVSVASAVQTAPAPAPPAAPNATDDLKIVRELRKHTTALFRVDANCGWTAEQTIEFAPALKELGVEFIEQPLPPEDVDGARRAFAKSALPLIADESCIVEADVDRCAGAFHGINIKLTKCGGLAPARRMAARARALGLQLMVGCMTESSVGISAIAQLLPLLDYVDMDGAVPRLV